MRYLVTHSTTYRSPEPVTIPHTARDLVSKATRRRFLAVGVGRW